MVFEPCMLKMVSGWTGAPALPAWKVAGWSRHHATPAPIRNRMTAANTSKPDEERWVDSFSCGIETFFTSRLLRPRCGMVNYRRYYLFECGSPTYNGAVMKT